MGGGSYSGDTYKKASVTRSSTGKRDFEYQETASKVHPELDPLRINNKPFGKLESRDSEEHPNSIGIVVCFDVTGSNRDRAVVAQKKLTKLMDGLAKVIPDSQIAIWANDDVTCSRPTQMGAVTQLSDFESDNRVDDHLRNLILVGAGGGNDGESYDLILYAAARKTVLDCVDKRGHKGYLFIYADEPFFGQVSPADVLKVYGDTIDKAIKIQDIIKEARELYTIYVIWPEGGFIHAREQYYKLFGKSSVIELQDPDMLVETIVSRITLDIEKEKALETP